MSTARTSVIRTALRPMRAPRITLSRPQTRLATTGPVKPGDGAEAKGTAKVYNHDGTNPNKNWIYLGVAGLGVGGVYSMFMARPEKVAKAGYKTDPDAVAHQRAERRPNTPPTR